MTATTTIHPPTGVALTVADVSRTFGSGDLSVAAVRGCSLAVSAGEMVALQGPSGSGKSTLLGIILGWITPDGGSVTRAETTRPIATAVIPQELGLLPELTARENIVLARSFHPVGTDAERIITQLGLDELLARLPAELSLGEQQRVAIARALTTDAAVVIADEPTSHQDEENAARIMSVLRGAADRGAAVLLTTHDPRIVASCDRLLEIVDGKLIDPQRHDGAETAEPTRDAPPRSIPHQQHKLAVLLKILAAAVALLTASYVVAQLTSQEQPDANSGGVTDQPAASEKFDDDAGFVEVSIASDALGTTQQALVFLPPGYDTGEQTYAVLYLLHGQMDRPEMFRRIGLFRRASELMRRSEIEPFIIVAPDIDNGFGVNNPESEVVEVPGGPTLEYDGGRYEDFLAQDLVEYVDANFRTIADREHRFVGGISMGGFAALHLAFRHPDLFSRVGGHSPALIDEGFDWLYPNETVAETRNPLRLATTADLSETDVFLDAGESDRLQLVEPIEALRAALSDVRSVRAEIWVGGHTDAYWRRHVDSYLRFYGE